MHILIFITFRPLSLTAFFCNERYLISSASSAGQVSFSPTPWCFATRLHPSFLQMHRTTLGHKPPNPIHLFFSTLGHKPPNPSHYQFVGDSRTLADSFILLLAPYVAQTRENGGDFAPRPLRVLRRRRHFSLKKSVSKEYSPQLHSSETTPRPSFITFTLMQK